MGVEPEREVAGGGVEARSQARRAAAPLIEYLIIYRYFTFYKYFILYIYIYIYIYIYMYGFHEAAGLLAVSLLLKIVIVMETGFPSTFQ